MTQWRNGLFACLLAAAALAAGCGDDNSGSDTSGGGGGGGGGNAPSSIQNAVDKCLDQAKSIDNEDARKTATAACKAAESGNTGKLKEAAKKECLKVVEQIPDSAKDQKETARKRCEAIK